MPSGSKNTGSGTRRVVDRRRFLKGTVGVGGVALMAGCTGGGDGGSDGGDGGDSGDGGGGETTGDSGSSGSSEPIHIGASAALTGKYSLEGKTMNQGYELWAEQINQHGGVLTDGDEPGLLGREVKLTVYDDQSDPSRAVNLYKRLINEDQVDVLMGPYSSAVSTSVIPIIEQNEKACVMPMMSDTSVLAERDVSYVTQAIAPAKTYEKGAIKTAADNGASTMAVIYEDTSFPTAAARGHIPYAEELGIEIVHDAAYPKNINDYTSVMNEVASKDPDIVMGGGYTPDAIGLTKAAKSTGFSAGIFAWLVGGQVPGFYESVGADARAMTGDLFWAPWFEVPHNQAFTEGFMSKFGSEYETASDIDYHSVGGYAGMLVMEQAIRNVGSLDQAAIAEELHALEMGIPFANGKYAVDDQGIQTAQAPSTGQWQPADEGDGLTRESIWPSQYATADPIYPHPGWG